MKRFGQARLIYDEGLDLYIDESNGIFIQEGEYSSYTYRIRRKDGGEKVENIVFSSVNDNEFTATIVTYDITYTEIEQLGIQEIAERNIRYSAIDENAIEGMFNQICVQTWKLKEAPPDEGNLTGGSIDPVFSWVLIAEHCQFISGGGSGSGSGPGSGSGATGGGHHAGGSSGGNGVPGQNESTLITIPIVKKVNNPDPWPHLMSLLDPAKYDLTRYINELATRFYNGEDTEVSYSFKRKPEFDGSFTYPATFLTGTATQVKILTSTHYVAIHLHPKITAAAGGIFSFQDLIALRDLYQNADLSRKDENEIALLVLAPDPKDDSRYNVYAITVKDISKLEEAISKELANTRWAAFSDYDQKIIAIQRYLGEQYHKNKNNLEAFFLIFYKLYGISLYKLDGSTWNQLGISSNQTVIVIPHN